jgi:DNA-binding NarL/FixJ family response regulator
MTGPPAYVVGADDLDATRAALAGDGWSVRAGWELPATPWDLADRRLACSGTVSGDGDVAAVLLAASRGAAVAAAVEPELRPRLIDELSRVTSLQNIADAAPGRLHDDDRALLLALQGGTPLVQAARQLGMSRRTATRRVADLRRRFNVATTSELLMRCASVAPPDDR